MESEDRLLMLAVTGEPLPDDDPDAAAVATDVALLREQVRGLGEALASRPERDREPAPAPAPVPTPAPARAPGRRPLRIAFGGLVVACAASLLGGLAWLGMNAPGGGDDAGSASDKAAAQDGDAKSVSPYVTYIACSRVLVEGRVTSITPLDDGDVRVVLDVERSYRPERPARTTTLTLDGAAARDLRPGTYTLIRIPLTPHTRDTWKTGFSVSETRTHIHRWLPTANTLPCPTSSPSAPSSPSGD
ncbi:hypothetical protein [Streptomyces sp. WG-D5]